ncbi:MAG: hypothetical protein JXA03_15545 [Bacteroidales bacterium]|nr:hypothetical protein [Bacteroidales bacterium]
MKRKFKDTKVGQFIGKVAPDVIDTVGDFFPPVKLLKALLPEGILTPDQAVEFNAALQEYELKELHEYLKDMQDARQMNVKIQQADQASKISKIAAYIIDFVIVGATILVGMMLFFKSIPQENRDIAYVVFGALLTLCGTVVNFHRGTSQGSSKKTDMMFNSNNSKL